MELNEIALCIVTYNPTEKQKKNIETLKDRFGGFFLFDNSFENLGLAVRYNQALKKAEEKGFKYLLLLDQDSYVLEKELDKFISCISKTENQNILIYSFSLKQTDSCAYKYNIVPISSGSLVNVKKALEIGGFNEELFIDEVDHEFALRGFEKGYQTVRVGAYLSHRIGEKKRILFFKHSCYPPARYYYMIRNFLYLKKKYKHPFVEKRTNYMVFFMIKSLLFCKNRLEIVKMIRKGINDFKNNLMGKQVEIS